MPRGPVVSSGSADPAERRSDTVAARLPALRAALERQRDFRLEQLAELDAPGRAGRASSAAPVPVHRGGDAAAALAEVDAIIATGARRALADIELALARMRTGRYGCCRRCGADIPLVVLEAIPKTTVCLACNGPLAAGADHASAGRSVGRVAPPREVPRRRSRARRRPGGPRSRTEEHSGTR